MSTLRVSLLVSLFALGACSATPVPIPFADGGLPSGDMNPAVRSDATAADGGVQGPDSQTNPPPCTDGGDATCGDAGPTDAVLEGPIDGGSEAGVDAGEQDTIHEGMGRQDKGRREAGHEDMDHGDTLSPDLLAWWCEECCSLAPAPGPTSGRKALSPAPSA